MARLKITLHKSVNSAKPNQVITVKTLGLKKIRQSVTMPDNPAVRGMIHTVRHLVTVEEISEEAQA
ncbi:MAG TPA: 50S ribosomal protein L30 [Clostridiales bacterium]|nr:50S ribosomal protein L30 [Clostridiales bacterium]